LTSRSLLLFVLLFGFCARAATYKSPLLDHHAWRQADTASISRNFVRERFNILYPQVDARGAREAGYVETGLEAFAFVVALVAKAAGFTPELGRLMNAVLFLGSDLLVWTFVKRRYGERVALVGAFLYAFGFPLLIFIERAFMNEALLICLSLVCLVSAQSYLASKKAIHVVVLVVASALVGAIKLPYLIVWAPVAGLFLEADGVRAWRRVPLWLMMIVDLVVAATWYTHAHQLGLATGLSFGLTDKLFDANLVFSAKFVSNFLKRLFKDVLGPVGCVGACAGVWYSVRERRWCEACGAAGFLVYVVAVAVGNDIHDYYQLAVMPIAPSLVSLGLVRLVDLTSRSRQRRAMMTGLLAFAAFASFARSASAHSWYEYSNEDLTLCGRVQELTRTTERVMVLETSDPSFLFCIDRKGWLLPAWESDEGHIQDAARQGGAVVVISTTSQNRPVVQFLEEHGTKIASSTERIVVRLNR
jgi:hypothetical protein